MHLTFVDKHGIEGSIEEDFFVEYDGPVPVESYVSDVVKETGSPSEAIKELLIDMNEDLDIIEIRNVE